MNLKFRLWLILLVVSLYFVSFFEQRRDEGIAKKTAYELER